MFILLLVLIFAIAVSVVVTIICRAKNVSKALIRGIATGFAVFAVLTIMNCFTVIPSGSTGIRTTFGIVSDETVPNGFQVKAPYVQDIKVISNKQQDKQFDEQVWGESSEKVPVYAQNVTVSFRIADDKSAYLFAHYKDINNMVSVDMFASAFKRSAAVLATEDVTVRSQIEPLTRNELQKIADEKYGADSVYIAQVVINSMDFEDSYNEAINNKNLARQQQEQQAIENQTAIDKASADAEVKKTQAQAEADAQRIEAQGKADANDLLNNSITEKTLMQQQIDKWDGQYPKVVDSNSNILIDPSTLGSTQAQ